MALGGHELLLIVRAQNQASAALGRVANDVRRLQNLRDIEMNRSQIINRLARNNIQQQQQQAKIASNLIETGRARLQHEQAIARNLLQQTNVQDRIANLEVRRTSLARASSNIEVQRLRLQRQELSIESSLEKVELRRQAINNQIGRLGTQLLGKGVQQEALRTRELGLQAQQLERQIALRKAERSYMRAVRAGGPVPQDITDRRQIARLRVAQSTSALGGLPGQQDLLASQARDIKASVASTRASMSELDVVERQLAKDTEILRERQRSLGSQLANVAARNGAVAAAERELTAELAIVENQLNVINSQWAEHVTATKAAASSLEVLINEERMLNAQLAEQDVLLRRQNLDRLATGSRAISHIGRVATMAGLVTVAAFGAMALSAAHFNTEAIRASTQTGAIGTSAQVVVNNASRIEKNITDLMQVIPANQHDMTDALYNIYSSMNTTFGGGTRLLKLFGQVWIAGGMQGNINEVADALITLGNNWKISANDMGAWQRLAASTLATVRFGRLTVEQYTQTMNQLAPAFHGANQSIEQMNGALAFLTRLLPSQRITAAGIARMMEVLQRFAGKPAQGFEDLAASIVDTTGSLKPLDQVIEIMIKRFPQLQTNGVFLTNFFKTISNQQGTVQARRAFQGFVQQFDLYKTTLANTSGDQKEFNRSLKAMEQSTGVKWATFVNQMRALGLQLGTAVIPAISKMGSGLQRLVQWFNGLSDSTKRNIGYFGAIAAGLVLVGGIVLTVVGSTAAMIISFRVLGTQSRSLAEFFGVLGKNSKGLASEAGFLNLRMVKVLGTFGLIVALLPVLVNLTGSLTGAVQALSIIFTAVFLVKMITAVRVVGSMRGALIGLRLATLGQIVAIVYLGDELSKLIRMIPGWDSHLKRFGGAIYDAFHRSKAPMEVTIANLKEVRYQMEHPPHKGTDWWDITKDVLIPGHAGKPTASTPPPTISTEVYRRDIRDIADQVDTIMNAEFNKKGPALPVSLIEKRMESMFPELSSDAIRIFVENAMKNFRRSVVTTRGTGFATREGIPGTTAAGLSAPPVLSDSAFLAALQHIHTLQKAFEQAPNLTAALAAWRRYHSALDALTKNFSKEQKKMVDDLLASIKDVSTITDSAVMGLARQSARLLRRAQATADPKIWKQYYAVQKQLQNSATQDQLSYADSVISSEQTIHDKRIAKAKDLHDKQVALAKDAAAKQKQAAQEAAQTITSATQSLLNTYNTALQQYQGQLGTLFSGPFMNSAVMQNRQQFGFNARPQDLLKDMRQQVTHFEKFQNTIERARRRGAPQALLDQISQLGPEAQKQFDTLLRQSPEQFKQYVELFKRGQKDAQIAAQHDLNRHVKQWEKFGKNVSLAIITGIKSQNVALEKTLRQRIIDMFPGLAGRAVKSAPAGAMRINLPTRVSGSVQLTRPTSTRSTQSVTHNDNRTTYNIHPTHKGEGLESMLRRAHFAYKHKKPL